ncbi:MAG: DUF177 domain-containing protein [Deltaproteobacteria bacterium]|nr:DUF177 domain-containing protein [Deltaproteobacteria bacterium]
MDIRDIPAEGLQLDIAVEESELHAIAGEVVFLILSPVAANLTLLKSDGEVFVRGDMASALKLQCARCLKEFEYKISSHIDIVYARGAEYAIKEKKLTQAEAGINHLEGHEIDINSVLLEQLSLDVPMQPVCRPDCRGLCHRCGADLNQGQCGCSAPEQANQRFARLKTFSSTRSN